MPGPRVTVRRVALIACGAPLAARIPELAAHLVGAGWRVTLVATPNALAWLDPVAVERTTGEPPRHAFRAPDEPKRHPAPGAVAVCPATFNTVNKAAAGITDTYAAAVLCEALGAGVPTVVVPMVNDKLWGHPAWSRSVAVLRGAGASFMDVRTGLGEITPVASGSGMEVTAGFDPAWLVSALPLRP
jgi:phosphopantothenoylcysteine synthetase/decarboxylase